MKRNLLGYMLCVFILLECFPQLAIAAPEQEGERYKVAICDWMILKRQKIGSFQLVHELNGDGVELDMGSLGKRENFDNKLRDPHFQQLFRETARKFKLEVPSVAMSGFYGQSFLDRANYQELVRECLDAMKGRLGAGTGTSDESCEAFERGRRYGCFRRFGYRD